MIVGRLGISAGDFWEMSPAEIRLILDAHKPVERVGKMSRETFDRLKNLLKKRQRELDAARESDNTTATGQQPA